MSNEERRSEPGRGSFAGWPDVADPGGEPAGDPDWRPYRSYPGPFIRALVLLFHLAFAAGAFIRISSWAGEDGSATRWVAASVGASAMVGFGIWWTFLGVSFCPAGVVVRNWTKSWYVPWPRAMGFELDRQGVWLITTSGPIQCQVFPRLRFKLTSSRGILVENAFLYPTLDRLQDEVRLRPRERAHDPDTAP